MPLVAQILTTPDEIAKAGSLVERLPKLLSATSKPVVVSIDSGRLYDPLAKALRAAGVPVFRSCDQAMRILGRYLAHRLTVSAGGGDGARIACAVRAVHVG